MAHGRYPPRIAGKQRPGLKEYKDKVHQVAKPQMDSSRDSVAAMYSNARSKAAQRMAGTPKEKPYA